MNSLARSTVLATATLLSSLPLTAQRELSVARGASIQAAIDAATNGDTILVAPGIYFEAIDFKGKAIHVIGTGGPLGTVLDASGVGDSAVRFQNGEGSSSVLQGFTVTGGNSFRGGGINGWSEVGPLVVASPTILDCIIRENRTASGFGGAGVLADATLERCSIFGNTAGDGNGGGVLGAVTMRHCVVADNFALEGGGVAVYGGSATIEDSVLVGNLAVDSARGGGLWVAWSSSATVTRTLIVENELDGYGYVCLGAGAYVDPTGSATFTNCTIHANRTSDYGQGSDVGGVAGNQVTIRNTILRDNDYIQWGGPAEYSNVEGGATGPGNIDVEPGFVDEAGGDYHILANAPGVDTGDPSLFDPDGTRSDMGAFHQQSLYTRANTTATRWRDPAWPVISLRVGGKQDLGLLSETNPNEIYRLIGSASGSSPGFTFRGVSIPLNLDAYSTWTLANPTTAPLSGFLGFLSSSGRGDATIRLSPGQNPAFAGQTLHHAAGIFGPSLLAGTNALSLELAP